MKAKKPLRILFFGTPDFAVASLDKILQEGYEVIGVVTSPDKPAGRGKKIQAPAVKNYALKHGLRIFQPNNLKDSKFIEQIKKLNPDIGVVIAFRKIPLEILKIIPYGIFNIHASLLPDYRGAAPIHHVIINGENQTGITTFFINDKIDTGEILLQKSIPITSDESFGSLYEKLKPLAAELTIKTLQKIENHSLSPQPQDSSAAVHKAPKLTKENTRINWHNHPKALYNFIRGLSPIPGAWTFYEQNGNMKRMIIYKAQYETAPHNYPTGKGILEKKKLKIAVPGGYLLPLELKPENKKRMSIQDFINGLQKGKQLIFR